MNIHMGKQRTLVNQLVSSPDYLESNTQPGFGFNTERSNGHNANSRGEERKERNKRLQDQKEAKNNDSLHMTPEGFEPSPISRPRIDRLVVPN